MTNWVELGPNEIGPDVVLTAPTTQALFDNVKAAFEGASGAPTLLAPAVQAMPNRSLPGGKLVLNSVTSAEIGPDAVNASELAPNAVTQTHLNSGIVGQAELKDATGEVTGEGRFVLPGGSFGFYPQTRHSDGSPATYEAGIVGPGAAASNTSYQTFITLAEVTSASGSPRALQRYVTGSPPFDMGDGEVRGFVHVLMRAGAAVATYIAVVPTWAYNGPTDIRPALIDQQGRKWRMVPKTKALANGLKDGSLSLPAAREMSQSPEYDGFDLEEITHGLKNADMPLVPHPFASAQPGDVVVLLDPMDPLITLLLEALEAGEDVSSLITNGKMRPDNEPLSRKGPPGVMQAAIRG